MFVADLGGDRLELDPGDDHHLRRALRLRPGARVTASDGRGAWRWCVVGDAGHLEADAEICLESPPSPAVAVAFALVKGDRPEWIVQKLTELGIDEMIPFESSRTVVRWHGKEAHHLARLRRVAREAAMQSRRVFVPDVSPVRALNELGSVGGVAVAEPGGGPVIEEIKTIVVGPEGGFSAQELALFSVRVGLPGGVLRTDTAAVTAGVLLATRRQRG